MGRSTWNGKESAAARDGLSPLGEDAESSSESSGVRGLGGPMKGGRLAYLSSFEAEGL